MEKIFSTIKQMEADGVIGRHLMTPEPMQQFLARKQARRKALAALSVGEKLRMLEEMRRDLSGLRITPAPKPVHPVRHARAQSH